MLLINDKIRKWKKENKLSLILKGKYKSSLRKIRESSLPQNKYMQYKQNCEKFECSKLTQALPGLVAFQDKPFKSYLSKNLSKREKFKIANGSLLFIEKSFAIQYLRKIYDVDSYGYKIADISLKDGESIAVKLTASPFQEEGELMLAMFLENKRIYSVCFSCTDDGKAYIGGIQGGKDISNDDIKNITKNLHGLRPKNMIMSLAYSFFDFFGVKDIYAVKNEYHVKSDTIKSNYSELWEELGGESYNKEWYKLPSKEVGKSIEEVKSKHRSQHLKKEKTKMDTKEDINKSLSTIAS